MMNALELLLNRHSQPRLQLPAPESDALKNIMQSALRAPDHGNLSPWRFIVCQGLGLSRLGEIFERAAIIADLSQRDIERASQLPHRAPMVIVAISKYNENDKVPWLEQLASTACAVQAMQMAALAQGYGGVWRTGHYAQDLTVKAELGLATQDELVGFLYLGTPANETKAKPAKSSADYFEMWD
jgi:nitroreductase